MQNNLMQTYICEVQYFGSKLSVELEGTLKFSELLEFAIEQDRHKFANMNIDTLGIYIPNRKIYVDKSQNLFSVFGLEERHIWLEIQQNNEPPLQQNPSLNFQNSENPQFTQYGQPQVQINQQHPPPNQNNQYANQQPYQQQQQFYQSQQPLHEIINVIIKMDQNLHQLVTKSDSTLELFYVQILTQIDFDGQYQLFFGNQNLSQLNQNLHISQVGIINNTVIELKKVSQIQNNDQFYQQMKFQQVQPPVQTTVNNVQQVNVQQVNVQQVNVQQINGQQINGQQQQYQNIQQTQPSSLQVNDNSKVFVKITIQDGLITREFKILISIYDILQCVVDSVLNYLGLNQEVAGVELKCEGVLIQGPKLQCTFQALHLIQNNIQMSAKIRYIGG